VATVLTDTSSLTMGRIRSWPLARDLAHADDSGEAGGGVRRRNRWRSSISSSRSCFEMRFGPVEGQ
jgi:hypothetical protein